MISVSINHIYSVLDGQELTEDKMNVLVAGSYWKQKQTDLNPIPCRVASQDVDDFLRLVLMARAGIHIDMKRILAFSGSMRNTGTLDFSTFIRRFNVWYTRVGSEGRLVRIIIPDIILRSLSGIVEKEDLHDTRWMAALLPPNSLGVQPMSDVINFAKPSLVFETTK